MTRSDATTVQQYLDALPEERRAVVATVREIIVDHLPSGYRETMNWGMICYEIPLDRYPETYNGQPLQYIAVAAQKRHYALYLTSVYNNEVQYAQLADAFKQRGKTLDMGKSCLRFHALDDVPWDVISQIVAGTSPEALIATYEAARQGRTR